MSFSNLALADSSKVVSLFVDGQKRMISTNAATVGEMLAEAGVQLEEGDIMEPPAEKKLERGFTNVNIYRAHSYLILDGSHEYRIRTAVQTPALVAKAAGLTVVPEDLYDTSRVEDIVAGGVVGTSLTIHRSMPLTIVVDGHAIAAHSQPATVAAVLVASKVSLGDKDVVTPAGNTRVYAGETVKVDRVTEVVKKVTETIARTTKTTTDPNLLKGTTQVKVEGADGHKDVTYRIHYKNGVETGRETLKTENQTAPVAKEVVVGTKVLFRGSVEHWRPFVINAAAAYGLDPNMMLRIMQCESGGNAMASNGSHFGLFQYDWPTWYAAGGNSSNIYDGELQINLTAKKMSREGTRAWECK